MAVLNDTWLYQRLLACVPSLPGLAGRPLPRPGVSMDGRRHLEAVYGSSGSRLDYALAIYGLLKAKMGLLACDVGFSEIWPSLICAEWSAHLRLENHLSGKLYRDHIFHPATVAMLGWELRELLPGVLWTAATKTLERQLAARYPLDSTDPNQTWGAVLDHAWLVAGFFHDHCYPIELLARQADALALPAGRPKPDALTKYRNDARVQHRQGHFGPDVLSRVRNGLQRAGHSHAALAALSLHALKKAAKNDFARAVLDVAADAVLWHHSAPSSELGFAEHPVRYLLVLCDGLHEFCRELALREETATPGMFTVRFVAPCRNARLEVAGNTVTVTYRIDCAAQPCDSRWGLGPFEKGLCEVQDSVNSTGPLKLVCRADHADCATCPAKPA